MKCASLNSFLLLWARMLKSSGLATGFQLLNKGAKATIIIPSNLASMAEQGMREAIPGNTPIVFDVEVVDVIHPTKK